jgi:predicted dehydrogenase
MSGIVDVVLVSFTGPGSQDHQRLMYHPALAADSRFRLVGVTEWPDSGAVAQEITRRQAGELGLSFLEFDQLLDGSVASLAVVCGAPDRRVDVVRAIAGAGLDMIIDKPMAASTEDARRIASVVFEAAVKCFPAHHIRFHPAIRSAAAAVANGRIGLPWAVQADFIVRGGPGVFPDGEIANFGLYPIDAISALIGTRLLHVSAVGGPRFYGENVEDFAVLSLGYEHDIVATVTVARVPGDESGFFRHQYRVMGSHGTLLVDPAASPAVTVDTGRVTRHSFGRTSLGGLLDHVHACLVGGARPEITADSGVETCAAVEAALRSLRDGVVVPVNERLQEVR